jgi:hypothetical protein
VVTAYLDDLADWLEKIYEQALPDDCLTAAEDAILAYIKNPMSYDPENKTLRNNLRMSADGDMKNLLKKERRHSARRVNQELNDPVVEKHLQDEEADPHRILERRAETIAVDAQVRSLVPNWLTAGPTPPDVQVLGLMRIGERRTRVYAAALGISHLPFREQHKK